MTNPYLESPLAPKIDDLKVGLPERAHILGQPYRPRTGGQGGSQRGSTRLLEALKCPRKVWYAQAGVEEQTGLKSDAPSARDVGTIFHQLAADRWAREAPDPPSWAYVPLEERLSGFPTPTLQYAAKLFEAAWPKVQAAMPIAPLTAEEEIPCTLRQLSEAAGEVSATIDWTDPYIGLFGPLSTEVVTALPDVLSYLGQSSGSHQIVIEDYKTKASRSGRLPTIDRRDAIDWQGALYRLIVKAALTPVEIAGFTHVRVERVDPDPLEWGMLPTVDRWPVPHPPLLMREAARLARRAVRIERRVAAESFAPEPWGLANGACFGRFRDYPCSYLDLCLEGT